MSDRIEEGRRLPLTVEQQRVVDFLRARGVKNTGPWARGVRDLLAIIDDLRARLEPVAVLCADGSVIRPGFGTHPDFRDDDVVLYRIVPDPEEEPSRHE